MLSQQFSLVGGGSFTQPSYADDVDNLGGLMLGATQIGDTRLVLDASDEAPENLVGTPTIQVSAGTPGPYNNMGIPGAKSFHIVAPTGYGDIGGVALGTANPYFVRMASSSSASVIGDAIAMNPTFFTCWIGANDVLAYATSGGLGVDRTGDSDVTGYDSNDITDPGAFENIYSTILGALTSGGAKGVVATIPSVTSIPYFTTIPYNPVPLDATTAAQLNAGYAAYNGGLDLAFSNNLINNAERLQRKVNFTAGQNPVVIVDNDLTDLSGLGLPSYRMTTSQDLIVLTARGIIGTTVGGDPTMINGVSVPLENQWVLTETETDRVATATTAYNNIIVSLAAANDDIAVLDANALMNQLVYGLRIETGQIYTADYFSGITTEGQVLFSLDGVHPNARGYAVIANAFINTINGYFNANLPLKYVNDYPGTQIVGSN